MEDRINAVRKCGFVLQMRDVLECARRKVVEHGDAPPLRNTALRQMRSDKPGSARNQDVHEFLPKNVGSNFFLRSNSRYNASTFLTSVSCRYCRAEKARPAPPRRAPSVRSSASAASAPASAAASGSTRTPLAYQRAQ